MDCLDRTNVTQVSAWGRVIHPFSTVPIAQSSKSNLLFIVSQAVLGRRVIQQLFALCGIIKPEVRMFSCERQPPEAKTSLFFGGLDFC